MAATFQLDVVAADHTVWSGEATMVIARTVEGELGILANHSPLMGVLAPGAVEIRPADGNPLVAVIDGGFLSVANNRISILAEHAEMVDDIDPADAQRQLDDAKRDADDSEESQQAVAAAQARVDAVEKSR